MENSSASTISPGSPTGYAPDAFRPWPSIGVFVGVLAIVLVLGALGTFFFILTAHVVALSPAGIVVDHQALQRDAIPFSLELQLGLDICIALFLLAVLPPIARTSLAGLGFAAPALSSLAVSAAGAVAMVLVVNGLGALIDSSLHTRHEQEAVKLLRSVHSPLLKGGAALLAVVFAPIPEELTFRVFIFNAVGKYGGFWIGAIVSGILFGLAHGDKYAFVPLAVGGVILCGVYARTRNAYMSMITHGLFNAVSVIALFFLPQLSR